MPALMILFFVFFLVLLPVLFGQLLLASLAKLHLTPEIALALVLAIIFGALINIPVKRIARDDEAVVHPFSVYGLPMRLRQLGRRTRETIIAVNVGGCVVPVGIAVYEMIHLATQGLSVLAPTALACAGSTALCYYLARPVPGVGIAIPGLVPPFAAAALALLLVPQAAPPVAFAAGVLGPLIGADLLHLKDVVRLGAGMASIGGAGTFDGIVLSGIIAAYLA